MESRDSLGCSIFDLAGKGWKVPHKWVHGHCARCGELEPKVNRVAQKRYSGKSNSVNKFNEYN